MLNILITEEDILIHEGINGDASEWKSDNKHDDGSNAGEALEDVEHFGERRRICVGFEGILFASKSDSTNYNENNVLKVK